MEMFQKVGAGVLTVLIATVVIFVPSKLHDHSEKIVALQAAAETVPVPIQEQFDLIRDRQTKEFDAIRKELSDRNTDRQLLEQRMGQLEEQMEGRQQRERRN